MPIKPTTPQSSINDAIKQHVDNIINEVVLRLAKVGRDVVNRQRDAGNYINRTGNLRSSTGYVVAVDGKAVSVSDFTPIMNGQQGSQEGRNYALSLVSNYPKGIVLIVVAGMEYAAYVAAKDPYDVLDTAQLIAPGLVSDMLKKLGLKIR